MASHMTLLQSSAALHTCSLVPSASRSLYVGEVLPAVSFRTQSRAGADRKPTPARCQAGASDDCQLAASRRTTLAGLALALVAANGRQGAWAASLPEQDTTAIKLCSAACEKTLDDIPTVTTESGLAYKDIVVGSGPSPPVGFQVAANYVAMVPNGKIFDSSLEKGTPYIFRVGSGQVIAGLDEGVSTMKVGGTRRLYIPGQLAFPKGLNSAPGRPRVAPSSPVVFDVNLVYVPGLEDEE